MRPLKNVQFCSMSRQAKILTTGIYVIFRRLKFELNAEIGRKGVFFKGLNMILHDIIPIARGSKTLHLFYIFLKRTISFIHITCMISELVRNRYGRE